MSPLFSRYVSGQFLRGLNHRLLSTSKGRSGLPDVKDDGSKFNIVPSRWNWVAFKNIIHMHLFAWFGPLTAVITYVNVTQGPATLEPTPEGYVPKEYEYHCHPIKRFFASIYPSYQQSYEIMLHRDWQVDKNRKQLQLKEEAKRLMREEGDYAAYYHVPITGSWARVHREVTQERRDGWGWQIDAPDHKRED